MQHVGSSSLTVDGIWAPLHHERGVSATGPTGKSCRFVLIEIDMSLDSQSSVLSRNYILLCNACNP